MVAGRSPGKSHLRGRSGHQSSFWLRGGCSHVSGHHVNFSHVSGHRCQVSFFHTLAGIDLRGGRPPSHMFAVCLFFRCSGLEHSFRLRGGLPLKSWSISTRYKSVRFGNCTLAVFNVRLSCKFLRHTACSPGGTPPTNRPCHSGVPHKIMSRGAPLCRQREKSVSKKANRCVGNLKNRFRKNQPEGNLWNLCNLHK